MRRRLPPSQQILISSHWNMDCPNILDKHQTQQHEQWGLWWYYYVNLVGHVVCLQNSYQRYHRYHTPLHSHSHPLLLSWTIHDGRREEGGGDTINDHKLWPVCQLERQILSGSFYTKIHIRSENVHIVKFL